MFLSEKRMQSYTALRLTVKYAGEDSGKEPSIYLRAQERDYRINILSQLGHWPASPLSAGTSSLFVRVWTLQTCIGLSSTLDQGPRIKILADLVIAGDAGVGVGLLCSGIASWIRGCHLVQRGRHLHGPSPPQRPYHSRLSP